MATASSLDGMLGDRRWLRRLVHGSVAVICLAGGGECAYGATVDRVSVDSSEQEANAVPEIPGESSEQGTVSDDGRFVAFLSFSSNLVPDDTNVCDVPDLSSIGSCPDIFVRDRLLGTTRRVSVSSNGEQAEPGPSGQGSTHPAINAGGRYVAFASDAPNLVADDNNGVYDIFLHDQAAQTTERVSVSTLGMEGDGPAFSPRLSADARFVAFESQATDLAAPSTPICPPPPGRPCIEVYVRDRMLGTTERVSVSSSGEAANGDSRVPAISRDGRFVAYESRATNLTPLGSSFIGVYVRDRLLSTTERVDLAPGGTLPNGNCSLPEISETGRFVAFYCEATNLDTLAVSGFFVRDRQLGTTQRILANPAPPQALRQLALSANGQFLALTTLAPLVPEDTNGVYDVYRIERATGQITRASARPDGSDANGLSANAALSRSGRFVTFFSAATNLVPGDTNGVQDVFLVDLFMPTVVPVPLLESPYSVGGVLFSIVLALAMVVRRRRQK